MGVRAKQVICGAHWQSDDVDAGRYVGSSRGLQDCTKQSRLSRVKGMNRKLNDKIILLSKEITPNLITEGESLP